LFARCHLPPLQRNRKQSVDDSQAALEIAPRSFYVPVSPIGVCPGIPGDARLNAARYKRAWERRYG
jgi:hypothetical protein